MSRPRRFASTVPDIVLPTPGWPENSTEMPCAPRSLNVIADLAALARGGRDLDERGARVVVDDQIVEVERRRQLLAEPRDPLVELGGDRGVEVGRARADRRRGMRAGARRLRRGDDDAAGDREPRRQALGVLGGRATARRCCHIAARTSQRRHLERQVDERALVDARHALAR